MGSYIPAWPNKKWWWLEQYQPCGCFSEARLKKDLLGYCKYHGGSRSVLYRVPPSKVKKSKQFAFYAWSDAGLLCNYSSPSKRYCKLCNKPLAASNPGTECFCHSEKENK